jgi:hypothetical protein
MEGFDFPLSFLGEVVENALHTVFHFPVLHDGAKHVAGIAGMDLVVIKFVLALFASVPLGALNRLFPTESLRHVWASVMGVFLMHFIFGARTVREAGPPHPAIAVFCKPSSSPCRCRSTPYSWRPFATACCLRRASFAPCAPGAISSSPWVRLRTSPSATCSDEMSMRRASTSSLSSWS